MSYVKVVDDFLPEEMSTTIENLLTSKDITWTELSDITFGGVNIETKSPGLSYVFDINTAPQIIRDIPFLGKMPVKFSAITRIVAFMQYPSSTSAIHNNKHVDSNRPHIVLLYYIKDSDGDTFLFSKDKEDNKISQRVTPKKNRAVIFDGSLYHASSRPQSDIRCVINFNLRS